MIEDGPYLLLVEPDYNGSPIAKVLQDFPYDYLQVSLNVSNTTRVKLVVSKPKKNRRLPNTVIELELVFPDDLKALAAKNWLLDLKSKFVTQQLHLLRSFLAASAI